MEPATSLAVGLPEFQRQLNKAIAAPDVSTDAFVALLVDDGHWLVDLAHLSEASVPPPLSRTGRASAWVVGIGSFRGQVHTVIDMRQVFSGRSTVTPQQAWATPLHRRWGGALALLWPQMVGLIGKPDLVLQENTIPERWAVRRWKDASETVWQEFDVEAFTKSEYVGMQTDDNRSKAAHGP